MILALDLGGTKTTAALVGDAQIRRIETAPTPAIEGADAVLANALELGRQVVQGAPITSVGIASAGVIDPATGAVESATDALPGWAGTRVAAAFEKDFGAPARALNDVHAHGLGEALHGAGAGYPSLLLVAVGTGIGGAHVVDGHVLTGAHHVAGHVGHVPVPEAAGVPCPCGRSGHLEGFASGPGILAAYRRAGGHATDTREVAALAAAGDELACATLVTAGRATGRVLGGLLNVFDPAVAVVTGGVAAIGPLWWDALRDGVANDAMDHVAATPVRPAGHGVNAALLGAADWSTSAHRDEHQRDVAHTTSRTGGHD